MLFCVHALDRPNALQDRLSHFEDHQKFLADTSAFSVQIVMSGPLITDHGEQMIGSLFVVEAPNRTAVERFNAADPYHGAGIWERITITGFLKRRG
ncbi:YciI family protein [Bosea sp. (in: a-proteobacteria)]|jgi:hypothetical protein|uniref:YciI family protein n=1 Tax=Bosea sp. (in: a-proteobacteria) TaxID=1871050 RepID=UPI002DDD3AFA|nr:YciI family protein [Bosea sp. (in: a-proteobacteria)]HEV2510321.1 YciI family protein [Bosea sp. (in: a-proteobacteria)]